MLKDKLVQDLKTAIKSADLSLPDDIFLSISQNEQFGDYTTNVALQISKLESQKNKQSLIDIAKKILENFPKNDYLEKAEVAGPGFLNFTFKSKSLVETLEKSPEISRVGSPQKILVEYAQPNTHKAFHIGHLRNISLGESIARLLKAKGNSIFRVTYGSDIGLPVAKALWGVMYLHDEYEAVKNADLTKKADFLGKAYAKGATSYEESKQSKAEIDELNKKIYQKNSEIMPLWEETRLWSLSYFEEIYKRVGTHFDREITESEVEEDGKKLVEDNVDKVFVKDQGAIIFPGEKYGLHNRVFITSAGNPTYEAKEVGLAKLEYELSRYDLSLHVVGSEQEEYFKVVFKALNFLYPKLQSKKKHISYGMVNLKTGKMSSRTGDVITADWLFNQVGQKVRQIMKDSKASDLESTIEMVTVGAVKFAMLKFAPNTEILFDLDQSVSLQGDSGPYVQYTYARTQSVLSKSKYIGEAGSSSELSPEERSLLLQINNFNSMVGQAGGQYKPNLLCQYLLELAKTFNIFYEKSRIIGSEQEKFRLSLTHVVGETLKNGLLLLGILAPAQM